MLTAERAGTRAPSRSTPAAVSAVVCTRDRPESLPQTIESVLSQSSPVAELIIVDDGVVSPASTPSDTPVPVRVLRTGGSGAGQARAAGLEAVRCELVAWCDDDDVWFPDHVAELLAELDAQPDAALVYGDAEWWQGGETGGVAYSIDYDGRLLRGDNYIFPSSALARVEAVRAAGGFDPALRSFEDWDLWLRLSLHHPIRRVPRTLGAMRWSHEGVAAGDRWSDWQRVHERNQARIAAAGAVAEHDLESTRSARFDRSTWSGGRRELLWHSILGIDHSFGVVSRQLIAALGRRGVQVRIAPTRNQPFAALRAHYHADDGRGRIGLYYDTLRRPSVLPAALVVNYSVWESTVLPDGEADEINRAVALQYVPSRRNRKTYLDAGVEVPVKVLPHGIDPERFPVLERPEREVLTFGTFGDFSPRKGIDVLVKAFIEEFAPDEPVRLLLKSNQPGLRFPGDEDPRIVRMSGHFGLSALHDLLRQMDVFVLPSRGEAWGMTGLEAMATGVPLIATNWDGPADYLDPRDSMPLSYELVDCDGLYSNSTVYHGHWAEPDRDHLRRLMRWCLEHRGELGPMGHAASERVRREFSWDGAAETLRRDLDELAGA